MPSIKSSLAAAGLAPLLALSLAACGGDGGGAPTDASVDEFCNVSDEFDSAFNDIQQDDYAAFVGAAEDAADRMEEVGTPEDIPEDARAGFEAAIDSFNSLDAGSIEDAVKEMSEAAASGETPDQDAMMQDLFGIDESDVENIDAFTEYHNEVC